MEACGSVVELCCAPVRRPVCSLCWPRAATAVSARPADKHGVIAAAVLAHWCRRVACCRRTNSHQVRDGRRLDHQGVDHAADEVLEQQGFTDIDDRGRGQPAHRCRRRQAEPLSGVKTLFNMICRGCRARRVGRRDGHQRRRQVQDNADDYAALIDQMMSMPDPKVPILWVDVYNPNQLPGTKMFNLVLREPCRGPRQRHGAVVVRSGIGPEGEDPAGPITSIPTTKGTAGVRRPRVAGGRLTSRTPRVKSPNFASEAIFRDLV